MKDGVKDGVSKMVCERWWCVCVCLTKWCDKDGV